MLSEKDEIRLRHMLEAAQQAIAFAAGRSREDLDTDRQLEFAITRAIEIIGEAAFQVTEEGRTACPKLPWREIVGMRHRIVHAYWDINRDRVWETVTENLPPLAAELERTLPAPPGETRRPG